MMGATAVIYTPSNSSATAENKIPGELWLQMIETYQVNIMASTPDIYQAILTATNREQYNVSSLRMTGSAGAQLVDSIQQEWQRVFQQPLYIALGMTEISTFISTGLQTPYRKGTIGRIQPGRKATLLPIDGGFDAVPANQMGMLAIHQDELGLMLGYVGESRDNQQHYRGPWFITQDLLSMNDEGYLTYFGRNDTLLKVDGGFRVSPVQVENVIKSCSIVKDAACGAKYDDSCKSDLLVAYVVCDQHTDAAKKIILDYARQHLDDYQLPHTIFFIDALPYNERGKLIRSQLGV
jgi:acyl-coenzyme A synthetase/AMP-(fatty) acid ligase